MAFNQTGDGPVSQNASSKDDIFCLPNTSTICKPVVLGNSAGRRFVTWIGHESSESKMAAAEPEVCNASIPWLSVNSSDTLPVRDYMQEEQVLQEPETLQTKTRRRIVFHSGKRRIFTENYTVKYTTTEGPTISASVQAQRLAVSAKCKIGGLNGPTGQPAYGHTSRNTHTHTHRSKDTLSGRQTETNELAKT